MGPASPESFMNPEQHVATIVPPGRFGAQRWAAAWQGRSMVLSGSLVMLLGSAIVSVLNFGYNVSMARMLGPASFGHVSALATLLMLASAVSLSFQLVCAKFVARNVSPAAQRRVYQGLLGRSWLVGLLAGIVFAAGSIPLANLLRLPSPLLIVVLAVGILFSVPLGAKRGALQGSCAFRPLAGNLIVESLTKFSMALLLVVAGYGVFGAVGAISASVLAAFVFTSVHFGASRDTSQLVPASFREGMQAIVFFGGQALINNLDILIVKSFFAPADAGLYAAVALFGRLLYFAAWQVISAMFPISAAARPGQQPKHVLQTALLLVGGIASAFILIVTFMPRFLVGLILGSSFARAEELLPLYAIATSLYAISVVLMAYEMSRKIANTGWLQLVFGGVLVAAISMFHSSLHEVIVVQIVLMALLLVAVSLPFLRGAFRNRALKEAL